MAHANGIAAGADKEKEPAMQVIILGSGGGPLEFNTTALLVRSLSSNWQRGCFIAVDGGVHMSAIARILQETQPPGLGTTLSLPHTLTTGPFAGFAVPAACPTANAAHIVRALVDTYLITHPHLDHISGMVINTAGLNGSRPKRLAGLPATIEAIKMHIFNNVIWPNLSDENNGAGLVTYMRLVEGGSPAFGSSDGDDRGYLEITEGLGIKTLSVSHGHCIERHPHRGSVASQLAGSGSIDYGHAHATAATHTVPQTPYAAGFLSPRRPSTFPPQGLGLAASLLGGAPGGTSTPLPGLLPRTGSMASHVGGPTANPSIAGGGGTASVIDSPSISLSGGGVERFCVYDSSAYFIRDVSTGREVLIFGDVEPDSISLSPRNAVVWREAAPKIAAGHLRAIFVECSYDDSQPDDRLFGHLAPRFVAQEMESLAREVLRVKIEGAAFTKAAAAAAASGGYGAGGDGAVDMERAGSGSGLGTMGRKRRRERGMTGSIDGTPNLVRRKTTQEGVHQASPGAAASPGAGGATGGSSASTENVAVSPRTVRPAATAAAVATTRSGASEDPFHGAVVTGELPMHEADMPVHPGDGEADAAPPAAALAGVLSGLKIVIIHVKDGLKDGAATGERILEQLMEYEEELQLGCEYVISSAGQDVRV